ncbi:hypothetical protein DY000_02023443 [Brassica cretica]|uniref:Uncharacterized protein n=1 Tax=Brassica cretica TaxID=69181 RepID=A0ABQ7E4U2_BRACR|nr:hypothetical protein DY000_02023443 [Brassica cretica]
MDESLMKVGLKSWPNGNDEFFSAFRVHLHSRKGSLFVDCISIQGLLWALPKVQNTLKNVKQVDPSRPVPYRSGLVFERVTVGQAPAGCGPQNG